MFEEIPTNICRGCRRTPAGSAPARSTVAEGCGHAVYAGARKPCYCDHCAYQRGVCTICGSGMATERPERRARFSERMAAPFMGLLIRADERFGVWGHVMLAVAALGGLAVLGWLVYALMR